jgi:hypothetical protein
MDAFGPLHFFIDCTKDERSFEVFVVFDNNIDLNFLAQIIENDTREDNIFCTLLLLLWLMIKSHRLTN